MPCASTFRSIAVLLCALGCSFGNAAPPRVLPEGELPADTRLGPLKGEQGDFNLVPAESPEQWRARSEQLRRTMLVALGLWPMPSKTPLNAVLHGRTVEDDYTVEKVYLESLPGFFVTGNLYRPKGRAGKLPAVLSPHGHFPGGRFQDSGEEGVRREIARGAERFEDGGRSVMQSRCVQLARMGCVVFHYDKIGYGDCLQLSEELVHRFSRSRVKYPQAPERGFYSAAAESRLQNVMGLHTYNSIRALDFLVSLPDVDASRIAVTGASGGGTQTFMLCAVDSRPLVSVPVVIVSADRQGGCTCENICGLRIDTHNLDFTALHAPKPLLLISADDATRTLGQRGFPELKRQYRALGAEENVQHAALLQFPHNYNYVSRAAMYAFVNRHLKLGLSEPIEEQPFRRLTREELTVWNDQHPQPPGGPEFEHQLLKWLSEDSDRQLAALMPTDGPSLARYREVAGTAWDILLRRLPDDSRPRFEVKSASPRGNYRQTLGIVTYKTIEGHRAQLPCVRLEPKTSSRRTVIWVDPRGKAALYEANGSITAAVQTLLDGGMNVIGVDLLLQGEFLREDQSPTRQRWLEGEEGFCGWTYCYNVPLMARRVHDLLAVVETVRKQPGQSIDLVGFGPAAAWCRGRGGAISRRHLERGARYAKLSVHPGARRVRRQLPPRGRQVRRPSGPARVGRSYAALAGRRRGTASADGRYRLPRSRQVGPSDSDSRWPRLGWVGRKVDLKATRRLNEPDAKLLYSPTSIEYPFWDRMSASSGIVSEGIDVDCPFPGMDPYLESHWRSVHHRLITYAGDQLQLVLPRRYRVEVEERVFVAGSIEGGRSIYPDVYVVDRGHDSGRTPSAPSAIAEPIIIELPDEPLIETYLEIVDTASGNRVVSAIEFLSPTNKLPGDGNDLYVRKQREYRAGRVSRVEIDLTREGDRGLVLPISQIPPEHRGLYLACVRRAWRPVSIEAHPMPLELPLRTIGVPLEESSDDVPLDLQVLIAQCYRNGRYDDLDYKIEPQPPLPAIEAAWADQILRPRGAAD